MLKEIDIIPEPRQVTPAESSGELRAKFISMADGLLETIVATAKGDTSFGSLYHGDADNIERVWELLHTVIAGSTETRKIEAGTTREIIKGVAAGKISIDEATKLMSMLKIQTEIDEVGELVSKLEALS